ncbi:DUF2920 family protein [Cohnella hashimotonis]|uniref:DUF2920 family protein n=1 Tax=Cohnella hashimotonis TaxID=2826895 RepID=A0ABT6TU47_9BACL|nr:DUF2920 family protein [Cohnella hashimotonis]MDI4650373.1 DUF2920 family protein [Cohnella hashimotonis]
MAKEYEFVMPGHPNIYGGDQPHNLKIYFSEPDSGVNTDTGIVLFIAGFGGHANSNVYKKMRSNFADRYNLVTVQCDFFGWEFMQAEPLEESLNNFNDMGLMQVLDNITAVMAVIEILKDNEFTFNSKKIIAYGHSHGAYLSLLCNRLAPGLFSLIIDNSAWLYPAYLSADRYLFTGSDTPIVFNYFAKSNENDKGILSLPLVYKSINKFCQIHSFHGSADRLITFEEKRRFCNAIRNCYLHEITAAKVDHQIFKSNDHGLDADFLLLFDYVMTELDVKFNRGTEVIIPNHEIRTDLHSYHFDYTNKIPILTLK